MSRRGKGPYEVHGYTIDGDGTMRDVIPKKWLALRAARTMVSGVNYPGATASATVWRLNALGQDTEFVFEARRKGYKL